MKNQLPKKWIDNLKILDIAFQPILNIHTGKLYAVEALLRNFTDLGFESIFALFDKVHQEGILYSFDIALREKTIEKFTHIEYHKNIKLFYNLDNRLFGIEDFIKGNTEKILGKFNLKKENICFEISERHEIPEYCDISTVLNHYQNEHFSVALDDFGTGHSGYKLLYDSKPDILKIDRFFLSGIEKNIKKKLMVRSIVNLSIQLGIKVIAEGIESKEELLICKEIGCHLVQGYLIQRPTLNTKEILQEYADMIEILKDTRRRSSDSDSKIKTHLVRTKPLHIENKMIEVIEYFKQNQDMTMLPIVDANNEPIGIIEELKIKYFLYSPFGISLLTNNNSNKAKIKNFLVPCGFTDINSDISTIIELFSNHPESVGIIITQNSKYYGFLSARAIITIMNEENLTFAIEQNPLTKLPGNSMIEKYMDKASNDNKSYTICYYDLDNFKAFNDVYGFRSGDRVILLFAQILKKYLSNNFFIAHIGGDDFFVATEDADERHLEQIKFIIAKFMLDVKSFYNEEDRKQGFIVSTDREENEKKFPLLSVSASVVVVKKGAKDRSLTNLNHILSSQKKIAKHSNEHIAITILG